jgi:hypothetical protein
MASTNINKFLKNIGSSSSVGYNSSKFSVSGSNKFILVAMALIGILVILVLIHFLVTPIFKTKMGSKGFIPLPTSPEGYTLWESTLPATLPMSTAKTPLDKVYSNYTISLDVYIERPNDIGTDYRTIFTRQVATDAKSSETARDTIGNQIGDYNLAIYLDKGTNDLHVSIMDTSKGTKTILIKNAPIREAFRLVVVVADTYVDVYMNNYLAGSATIPKTPLGGADNIFAPSTTSIKVKNAKAFGKALEPAEAKDIRPGIAEFTPSGDIPDSTTCSST